MKQVAVIFGTGPGLGAALARRFVKEGLMVAVAARDVAKLSILVTETGARAFACDVGDREQVEEVFSQVEREMGPCEIVVFNAAQRYRDSLTNLDPDRVANAFKTGAFGGFLVGQAAARVMLPRERGSIFFTGATASVKGMAQSAPFAMQKFALRGLAQSIARELHPLGIHVAHIIIDGRIASDTGSNAGNATLDPNAIAATYLDLHEHHTMTEVAEVTHHEYDNALAVICRL